MTYKAEIFVDPRRTLGEINPLVYGQFIEHIGRAIYGGVFEPNSPLADRDGYRLDVLEAAREMAPPVLRWPGGNFASGYHWRDGVGPREERPVRRDLAWSAIEDNSFGTEEFLEYCRRVGAEPYLNLNMGTGTIDEALQWLEYCNATEAGIPEAELRRRGPHPDPHGVRLWGLGNEVYGWWQHGNTDAGTYGEMAREWGKLLRWTDSNVKLIGVGSRDPAWNWTVLTTAGRSIDYLSLHFYWRGETDPYYETLSGPPSAEAEIVAAHAMCAEARRALNSARPASIAVDEWGIWSRTIRAEQLDRSKLWDTGITAKAGIDTTFEEAYDLKDALAVAGWLHVLWRHPEKVGLATQAQMVNVLGPIHSTPDAVVRHTIHWPLKIARQVAGSEALDVAVSGDEEVPAPSMPGGSLPALDAGGTMDPATGRIHLSLVNRSRDEDGEVWLSGAAGPATIYRLWHEDPLAGNTAQKPENVQPVGEKHGEGLERLVLPAHSHTTVVIET